MTTQITKPDIHNTNRRYELAEQKFINSEISSKNKELCLSFITDLKIGWGGNKKVNKLRLCKYFISLKTLTEWLEALDKDLSWLYVQKNHVKELLLKIDSMDWSDWSKYSVRVDEWLTKNNGENRKTKIREIAFTL